MRAVVIHQFGKPDGLTVEEVPTPKPRGDEVLVKIHTAGINPSDVKNVAGTMRGTTLPRIPGRDFSGVVLAGAGQTGQEVWGTGGDIGFTRDGSHAEFILLPKTGVTPKPASLSMEAAGNAGLTFVTAWSAMVSAVDVSSRDTALIIGAAGGVGSVAVQIAKSRGARVIGVVLAEKDIATARDNGADEVINSKAVNLAATIQALTENRGANVVFDTSGYLFAEAVEAASLDARIAVITAPPDGKSTFDLRNLYRKELQIRGVDTRRLDATACAKLLAQMTTHFKSGQFKSKPGKAYSLESAVEAYEQASKGDSRIVLQPMGG